MERMRKMEKAETSKEVAKVLDGEMIEIKLELFSPFVKFLKDYLDFFGCKKTLETLCMEMIYEQSEILFCDLQSFVDVKRHFLESDSWYWKHPHMSVVSTQDEIEKDTEKADC